jgi:hypothetical protein
MIVRDKLLFYNLLFLPLSMTSRGFVLGFYLCKLISSSKKGSSLLVLVSFLYLALPQSNHYDENARFPNHVFCLALGRLGCQAPTTQIDKVLIRPHVSVFISTLEAVPLLAIWPIIGWLGSMVGKTDIKNPPIQFADLPFGLYTRVCRNLIKNGPPRRRKSA